MSPDPYLQVESQITSELPDFTFRGRDDDLDSIRARQREDVVRYILTQNRVADEMASNDRALPDYGKFGVESLLG